MVYHPKFYTNSLAADLRLCENVKIEWNSFFSWRISINNNDRNSKPFFLTQATFNYPELYSVSNKASKLMGTRRLFLVPPSISIWRASAIRPCRSIHRGESGRYLLVQGNVMHTCIPFYFYQIKITSSKKLGKRLAMKCRYTISTILLRTMQILAI